MSNPSTNSTSTSRPAGEHVILTLVSTGQGPPFAVRVRSLLKRALRAYGLRCVGIAGKIGEDTSKPASEPQEGQQGSAEAAEAKGG